MIKKFSPNYSGTTLPKVGFQFHKTLGNMPGTLDWLLNPKSQASCHYLITKSGPSYQLVDLEDRAWTSGRISQPSARGKAIMDNYSTGVKPGEYLIQFEVECLEHETYNEKQYAEIVDTIKDSGIKAEDWNTLTHQDTAIDKPHLENERLNILRRLNNNDLLLSLQIKVLRLKLALWISRLIKLRT